MIHSVIRTLLAASAAAWGVAEARDTIRIVGSSTVYPYASTVAETFGANTAFPTPVVESTGTGGGFKLFCAGAGDDTPDVVNASRRVKASEFELCKAAGVDLAEVKVGYDGIVFAHAKGGADFDLTLRQVFMALAKEVPDDSGALRPNPYQKWSDIDPSLPDERIEVFGPPPTSGTRDAFVEIAMEGGALEFPSLKTLDGSDHEAFRRVAHTLREDGAWIDAGENDNAIVNILTTAPTALGVFGYSFLDQNSDRVAALRIDGVTPTLETISSGDYPVARSLFFYVKINHAGGVVPGIEDYVAEFTSDGAWGPFGYLVEKGLIPLPDEERASQRDSALALAPVEAL